MKHLIPYNLLGMLLLLLGFLAPAASAQDKELKIFLNDEKTHYIRGTGLGLVWVRYTDFNPGSTMVLWIKNPLIQVQDYIPIAIGTRTAE